MLISVQSADEFLMMVCFLGVGLENREVEEELFMLKQCDKGQWKVSLNLVGYVVFIFRIYKVKN